MKLTKDEIQLIVDALADYGTESKWSGGVSEALELRDKFLNKELVLIIR